MNCAANWDCRGARIRLFDAKHSPDLVLALFSRVLGVEQKDWPQNTLITGFCFYDADAGNAALPAQLEEFLQAGQAPVVFTLGSAAVLAAGKFYEHSARAAVKAGRARGAADRERSAQPAATAVAGVDLRGGVCALFGAVSRARRWWCTRAAWGRRRSACGRASRC